MNIEHFLNLCEVANSPTGYADSLILVYLDNHNVQGPYFSESDQYAAFDNAVASRRPFTFQTWAFKG